MRVGCTGKVISPRSRQTTTEFDIPYSPRLFSNSHHAHPVLEAQHYDHTLVVVASVHVGILVDTTHPNAIQWLGRWKGRAQFRERVEGQRVVAEDAGLVDLGEEENLLDAGADSIVVGGLKTGCEDEAGRAEGIIGFGRDQDEVEDLSSRRAYVDILTWKTVSVELSSGVGGTYSTPRRR
jgi:hypothetical protein